jgi:hypothetical protein
MPDNDDLTPNERAILFILMAEGREIPNTRLTKHYKGELAPKSRDRLKQRGLINIRMNGSRVNLELADAGWKHCLEEMSTAEPPGGAGARGTAAYAMLDAIRRYMDRSRVPHEEFFQPSDEPTPQAATPAAATKVGLPEGVEARIRQAYSELARRPGDWVRLADVRLRLSGVEKSSVDRALVELNRVRDISMVPANKQMELTDEDRAAAVSIGNQDRHLIAIG